MFFKVCVERNFKFRLCPSADECGNRLLVYSRPVLINFSIVFTIFKCKVFDRHFLIKNIYMQILKKYEVLSACSLHFTLSHIHCVVDQPCF